MQDNKEAFVVSKEVKISTCETSSGDEPRRILRVIQRFANIAVPSSE